MPADEPDEPTGAVRGRRASGRHRTEAAPQTPEVGFPAPFHRPDHRPDPPRHARGGGPPEPTAPRPPAPPDPSADGTYDDRNGSNRNGSNRNGSNRNGSDRNGGWHDSDWTGGTWNDSDWTGGGSTGSTSTGSSWNDSSWSGHRDAGDRNGGDQRAAASPMADSARTTDHETGRQSDTHPADARRDDPYRAARYTGDAYTADAYSANAQVTDARRADTYGPAQQQPETHRAPPDRDRRRSPDRYAAPTPNPYGPDTYGADAYEADAYWADAYGPDTDADPGANRGATGRDRIERGRPGLDPAPLNRADGRGSAGGAGANGHGSGANGNGSATGADDRYGTPRYGPRYEPDPEPPAPAPDHGADQAGGRELPPRPERLRTDPGLPGLPSRRPGDPPAVPAELFVETTAETPALTAAVLARHGESMAPAPTAPEADPTAGKPESGQPPGRRRVFGVPLPGWAHRLLPGAQDDAGPDHPPGHGHGHGPARPAGRRVRILIAALLVPCALATLVGLVLLWPSGPPPATAGPVSQDPVRAQVTATQANDCSPGSGDGGCVAIVVHMADGPRPGKDLVQVVPVEPGSPRFSVGDQVVLGWSGANPDDAGSYQVVDFQRGAPLAWLAGLFAAAVLLLGRWRGLAALAALVLSFVVLLFFVVPAILAGRDPLAVAIVGACLIMFAVLYLTHGPSARTSTAVLGTLLSLALIGALGVAFSAAAELTGLDDQTSNLISTLGAGVDARGLLLAGVLIGALGVLDDVTVTQTSAVWELRHANPGLTGRGLFAAAMRIGRDHVASAVNTLVLAYAGAALPLLLLFSLSGRGFGDVVTSQDVATEIVRTLVGSIGLVASVPITTALAAAVAVRETVRPAEQPANADAA